MIICAIVAMQVAAVAQPAKSAYTENARITIAERAETTFNVSFLTDKDSLQYLLVLRQAGQDMVVPDSAKKYKPTLSNDGDKVGNGKAMYIGKAKKDLQVIGVPAESKLLIDIFSVAGDKYRYEKSSDTIFTLATEPRFPANDIMFHDKKTTGMWVLYRQGNGANRIILMSKATDPVKGSDPKPPKDGTPINPGITGAKDTWQEIGNNTYVVYNSYQNPEKQAVVTGLEPATRYWFYCLEYNGLGKATNFKAQNGAQNPRLVYTLAAPPKLNKPKDIKAKSFLLSWEPLDNAMSYVIDIAYDEDFTDKVDVFNELDVELNTELAIELDAPIQPKYYVRVMAYLKGASSPWSETLVVEMN